MPSPSHPSLDSSRYAGETSPVSPEGPAVRGEDRGWHLEEPQAITPAIHPLLDHRIVVGRSLDADVLLHHRDVSRRHLRLTRAGPGYQVADLGSRFGTAVNGRDLEAGRSYVLADGDLLRIGRRVFALRRSPALVTAAAREMEASGSRLFLHPIDEAGRARARARVLRLDGLGPWVVGRHSVDAALPLQQACVSRQHAVFARRGHTWWVRDLSEVGTTAGGTRLRPGELMRLVDGDVVGLQDVRFRVEIGTRAS